MDDRVARRRWRRPARWAGPALIVVSVLFALRGFLLGSHLTNQHPDLLTFWLPRWAFLGRSIAAGDLPLWNPFEMAGYRFAADPQSGWLYVPPMVLFASFPPGLALRLFIVLNPLLCGLGMFAFLRSETLGSVAATAAGLVASMTIATSTIAISLPFAGALAWTTIVLLTASRFRRAGGWPARLAWTAAGGFAWSQVASAHLSHGLVIATLFLVAYLLATTVADARTGAVAARAGAGRTVLFLIVLPLAALPVLIPRIDAIGSSSLRGGYGALDDPGQTEVGDALGQGGLWAGWPLGFAAAPGAYAGATALTCSLVALRSRRRRPLAVAAGGLLALAYILTWPVLVAAGWFRALMLRIPFGDVYLHNPARLRYIAMLSIPILVAIGVEGLLERPMAVRTALAWIGAAGLVFVLLPVLLGDPVRYLPVAAGFLVAAPLLLGVATRRWRWATVPLLVAAIAAELAASAIYSQAYEGGTIFTGLESGAHPILVPQVLRTPDLSEEAYLRATAIVAALRRDPGRYATWAPPEASFEKGYLWMKSSADWPALAPSRGTLFGVPDALGYNPVQSPRYWRYIRATNELSVFYNASVLNDPSVQDVRLLGLRYLVVPAGLRPPVPGEVVRRANRYSLWRLYDAEPLATVTDRIELVDDDAAAVRTALSDGFDPSFRAVIASRPDVFTCVGDCEPPAIAQIVWASPTTIRMRLPRAAGGILTVRNAYDPGWRATVDGRPARTLPVDGFLQGVLLPPAAREIALTYRDDAVSRGLVLGGIVWAGLLVAPLVASAAARRLRRARPDA